MSSNRKQLKRALLASSCLTVFAAGSAQATVYTEGPDLSNDRDAWTVLDPAIRTVIGTLNSPDTGDGRDAFSFTGLTAGETMTISFSSDPALGNPFELCQPFPLPCLVANSSTTFTPTSAREVFYVNDLTEGSVFGAYQVSLTSRASEVPVAPSAALIGLGLAAIVGKRRKHGVK